MAKTSNVYKDKKTGKYYFVASLGFDLKGKRIQKFKRGFKTAKEAKKAYNQFMIDYQEKREKITFGNFYEEYYKCWYKNHVKESTFKTNTGIIENHLSIFNEVQINAIETVDLQKLINYLSGEYKTKTGESLSPEYINLIICNIQSVFERAFIFGFIDEDISKKVSRVRVEEKEVNIWTIDDMQKVMLLSDESDSLLFFKKMFFRFLFMTGLRLGEALALNWEDVDFDSKVVYINKTMLVKNKREFRTTTPKTKSSIRTVSLDDETLRLFEIWREQQSPLKINLIFSIDGGTLAKSTTHDWLKKICDLADVPVIKIHALRHSHASMLIALKEDSLVIKERLGHSRITTTLEKYGHLYNGRMNDVSKKLTDLKI
ncbi:TPA: site-specific integrase [Enterococcus faecalis]|nr:site-specific integrase [Enterococcus faecalis]HDH7718003.1 site-specific integrase [Enterococcus faecalis]HDH7720578.1 site-specific integrase [Enterococcus faecalis]HDH7723704.1 site-specific integrase [Enterococcus faecalis]